VAIDENRHQREETLNRRIALEAMLKDLSTKAIAIEDTSAFIGEALTMLGTRMAVGGAFFWEFNPAQKTLSNTHEWLAKGQAPKKPSLQDIPIATLPWAVSRLMKGEILRISDARELPGKSERGLLEEIGVKACLVLPLFSRENFFGFMGFECFNGPKSWLPEDVQILQTAAEIMMRCIENRQLTRELIASQKNLEKTVGKKTLALRKTNRRLAAEIAAHMESIAELKRREADLAERNKAYMELSNALAALVSNPRAEADPDGQCLIHRLTNLVDPAVANRAAKGPDEVRDKYMGTLRSNLRQLSSLLTTKKSFVFKCLTRMEIQVAELIMQDKGNKEIADLLNLSRRTVEVHRYNIRKKLQFDKSRVNLKTYLLSME
jgi:DNA-binding CsgD family transcriptional regulator